MKRVQVDREWVRKFFGGKTYPELAIAASEIAAIIREREAICPEQCLDEVGRYERECEKKAKAIKRRQRAAMASV